jgi:hypothetical protein
MKHGNELFMIITWILIAIMSSIDFDAKSIVLWLATLSIIILVIQSIQHKDKKEL